LFIIAGLGNPGQKYENTRHNVGFKVIDALSQKFNVPLKNRIIFIFGEGVIEGKRVILLKPLTFMNKSGLAIRGISEQLNIDLADLSDKLIVIHDDLDIDIGNIKIKKGGSSGGHRGVDSIINILGLKDFIRIKIGIGRPLRMPVDEYVLSNFKSSEKKIINDVIIKASEAVVTIMTEGIEKAMSKYNRRIKVL
jgi:PTH1 family peptidyl-tRNA hydrolase